MNNLLIPNLKIPSKKQINRKIRTCITDLDIKRILGQDAEDYIMVYSDLQNYKTIQELLPGPRSFIILLIEFSPNNGHWIAILRDHNTIEVFNSFSSPISSELDVLSNDQKQALGENHKWLNILLDKAKKRFKIVKNRVAFQSEKNDVNTCGRYVLLRVAIFLVKNFDLQQFINFMQVNCNYYHLTPDYFVSIVI